MTFIDPASALIDDFGLFDDWEDRYAHLIALGKALPPMADEERIPANKVSGCTSQVWLVLEPASAAPDTLSLRADSDSHIVKGLAAILHQLYNNRPIMGASDYDPLPLFAQIGLDEHLSPQRAGGLRAMIDRIRADAKRAQNRHSAS